MKLINLFFKKTLETIKHEEKINKSVQELKIEIEAIKKTQTEAILKMENLGMRTKHTVTSITNRMKGDGTENLWGKRYERRN
jgi:predicted transcriptional regulator